MKLLIFFALTIFILGCSSHEPVPEATISRLRVQLKMLPYEVQSTDYRKEEAKYLTIAKECKKYEAFQLAALAYSMLANNYEKLGDRSTEEVKTKFYKNALSNYQKALIYDKKEQEKSRTPSMPFINSAEIAVSLNNISVVYEKLGRIDQAIFYGLRALRINQALAIHKRVLIDCERLSELNKKIGDNKAIEELQKIKQNAELQLTND